MLNGIMNLTYFNEKIRKSKENLSSLFLAKLFSIRMEIHRWGKKEHLISCEIKS